MPIDPYTIKHLRVWLNDQIHGDTLCDLVEARMVEFIGDDPEYWGAQSWWNVYDRAKCIEIQAD